MHCPVLIVPGHGNSGPAHWQSLWQARHPSWRRLHVNDWEHAVRDEWVAALDRHLEVIDSPPLVVAHSLGCLVLVHWAALHSRPLRGAMLVAVPDPAAPAYPTVDSVGFTPVPHQYLPFSSMVVTSTDDPYGSAEYAQACASAWGSAYVEIGPRGHVNAASGLGEWTEGYLLLAALAEGRPPSDERKTFT